MTGTSTTGTLVANLALPLVTFSDTVATTVEATTAAATTAAGTTAGVCCAIKLMFGIPHTFRAPLALPLAMRVDQLRREAQRTQVI